MIGQAARASQPIIRVFTVSPIIASLIHINLYSLFELRQMIVYAGHRQRTQKTFC